MEEEVSEKIQEVNSEEKPKRNFARQGKLNRAAGARFELKVRELMKKTNWVLDRWTNNIDLQKQELAPAKKKFNPFKKMLVASTGFPDFVGFKYNSDGNYEVIGIEVKMNGFLSYEEKLKCIFYLDKKIFSRIFIARAKREGRKIEVELEDFKEKYGKKYIEN
ncbi:hypothetical protein J4474_02185 [Candidatus Pacearchaeota archaeon]|nr:hypothetical protein [Candidatus Pacearchaeota archaeon]